MPCGNQNLSDFDQFWSMFSDLKHVLCTDAIIRPLQWLPEAFAISWVLPFITATVTASVWCVHIFSVYSVLESHICQYSHRRWLYQKLKSCLASAQRRFEEDDSALLQSDTSVTPTARLGAFLECSWDGRMCFATWSWNGKRGRFEWMQILSEDLGQGDFRWTWKGEMGGGRQMKIPRGWEGFRWRNVVLGMCYFQPGATNSIARRQENKWGWEGWWELCQL